MKIYGQPSIRGRAFKIASTASLSGLSKSTLTLFLAAGSSQHGPMSSSMISIHVIAAASDRRAVVSNMNWIIAAKGSLRSVAVRQSRRSSSSDRTRERA